MPDEIVEDQDTGEQLKELLIGIKAVRNLLGWIGSGILFSAVALIWALVADHFDQVNLRQDVDWMRPKVERLWYKSYPDAASATTVPEVITRL